MVNEIVNTEDISKNRNTKFCSCFELNAILSRKKRNSLFKKNLFRFCCQPLISFSETANPFP